jgi:serine/threonine-protein kinase
MTAEVLAGYELEERIGIGGMAEVFRACRIGPGGFAKQVALKRVLPDLGRDPQFVRMFLEEARLQAQLSSPGLIQVFDFGEQAGTYFMVMEYVDGADLGALLAAVGPLEPGLGAYLGRQLCGALADVHRATDATGQPLGIVHRDVTPGNILLSRDGHVKLGDFGVAKARARSVRTERGAIKGKLAYLSPEQVRGDEVDARTDVYGLGLVLFEVLTGSRYLDGASDAELLRAAGRPVFRAPSAVRPGIPPVLDDVLRRALAVEPERRYPSASQFEEALGHAGPALEAGAARRQIGELVRGLPAPPASITTKGPSADELASAPTEPGLAAAEVTGPVAARRRRTEVVAAAEIRGRTAPRRVFPWIALAGGVGVVALVLGVRLLRTTPSSVAPAEPVAARESAAADGPTGTAFPGATPASAPQPPAPERAVAATPRVARGKVSTGPSAAPAGAAPAVPAAAPPTSAPGPRALDPAAATRDRLAAIDGALRDRGLLPGDAPQLAARRRTLAAAGSRGEASLGDLDRLLADVRAFPVDRTFVAAKLERLNRAIAGRDAAPEVRERLQRHAQQALSHSVMGRYDEANRELNEIAALIAR